MEVKGRNLMLVFTGLIFVTLGFFILDVSLGPVNISLEEIWKVFLNRENQSEKGVIFWELRLPKALTALVAGAGLGLCGLLMQTLFKNPLAGPFVLGISSGSSLGVAVYMLFGSLFGLPSLFQHFGIPLSAIIGSSVLLLIILLFSGKVKNSVSLLIIGIMFGSISGSLVSILQYFSEAEQSQNFVIWTFGSLSGINWQDLNTLYLIAFISLLLITPCLKALNAWFLHESHVQSLGLNVVRTRFLVVLGTGILAGGITAYCGPIAFIGLSVPHLARGFLKTGDHKLLFPACLLIGALLLLICDLISTNALKEVTLPINAITALFGAPVVIWIIFKNNRKSRF